MAAWEVEAVEKWRIIKGTTGGRGARLSRLIGRGVVSNDPERQSGRDPRLTRAETQQTGRGRSALGMPSLSPSVRSVCNAQLVRHLYGLRFSRRTAYLSFLSTELTHLRFESMDCPMSLLGHLVLI